MHHDAPFGHTAKTYKAACNLVYLANRGVIPLDAISKRTLGQKLHGDLAKEARREAISFDKPTSRS